MVAIMALSLWLVCVCAHVRFGSLAPCGLGSRFGVFGLLFLVWGDGWLPALLWLVRPALPLSPLPLQRGAGLPSAVCRCPLPPPLLHGAGLSWPSQIGACERS